MPCSLGFQDSVWEEVGQKEVIEVTKGFTATIFAYGQTGAGKTFSMLGPDKTSPDRVRDHFTHYIPSLSPHTS